MSVELESAPGSFCDALRRLAPRLGVPVPAVFSNPRQKQLITLPRSATPCVVLGPKAFEPLSWQQAELLAASSLVQLKPGFALRQVATSLRSLKASWFAALRLGAHNPPLADDLQYEVDETARLLEEQLTPDARLRLRELSAELVANGAEVNLRAWLRGIELSSDRVGLSLCDDLGLALQGGRSGDERYGAPSRVERQRELLAYAVSGTYLALRAELGVSSADASGTVRETRLGRLG